MKLINKIQIEGSIIGLRLVLLSCFVVNAISSVKTKVYIQHQHQYYIYKNKIRNETIEVVVIRILL